MHYFLYIVQLGAEKTLAAPAQGEVRMFETRGELDCSLRTAFERFCSVVNPGGKESHPYFFIQAIKNSYGLFDKTGFRNFRKIRELINRSYNEAFMFNLRSKSGCPNMIGLVPHSPGYSLEWVMADKTKISIRVSWTSQSPHLVHVLGPDLKMVRQYAREVGLSNSEACYTRDTLFTLKEAAELVWGDKLKEAKVPIGDLVDLLERYSG